MKLGKTSWYVLGIGILVIAAIGLFMLYQQEAREQEWLNEDLAAAQAEVPKLAAERATLESTLTELEDNLAQAISKLKTAKAAFPAMVESIEYDEQLFRFAKDNALDIVIVIATEPSDEDIAVEVEDEDIEVEDVTYFVTYFTVEVTGQIPESVFETEEGHKAYIDNTVDDILNFINTIATHRDFTTATIETVNMVIPEPLTEEELVELKESEEKMPEESMPSATINLVIYGYKGG